MQKPHAIRITVLATDSCTDWVTIGMNALMNGFEDHKSEASCAAATD